MLSMERVVTPLESLRENKIYPKIPIWGIDLQAIIGVFFSNKRICSMRSRGMNAMSTTLTSELGAEYSCHASYDRRHVVPSAVSLTVVFASPTNPAFTSV